MDPGRDGVREDWILAAFEKAHSINFYVHIEFETVGSKRPRDIEIAKPLQAWLDRLDADEIEGLGFDGSPELTLEVRDWVITFRPLPVKPDAQESGRPSA